MFQTGKKKITNLILSASQSSAWLSMSVSAVLHTLVISAVLWVESFNHSTTHNNLKAKHQTTATAAPQVAIYPQFYQSQPLQGNLNNQAANEPANKSTNNTPNNTQKHATTTPKTNLSHVALTSKDLQSAQNAPGKLQRTEHKSIKTEFDGNKAYQKHFEKGLALANNKNRDHTTRTINTIPAQIDAQFAKNNQPAYPKLAKRLGLEGTVVLNVTVNPSGKAQLVQLAQSSGFEMLDKSAIETLSNWKYRPAEIDGEKITQTLTTSWTYKLENK